LSNRGTLTVSDSTLSGNPGGGISNSGTLTVTGSTLSGNSGYGGIYNTGMLTVSNSTLSGNSGYGGIDNTGMLTVSNSTLSNNSAVVGGGIYNFRTGTVTVTGSGLSGNSADYKGGGIFSDGGVLTVSNSTLSGNSADNAGGGIFNNGTLTLSNCNLSDNSVADFYSDGGGGIYNSGTLTVSNCTLSGNSAIGGTLGNGWGGGIANYGMLTVTGSTLSGNSAFSYGGGIDNDGTLTVSNSTLSGNSARYGGGIITSGTEPVTLTNVTLTANRAINGGGGFPGGGGFRGGGLAAVLHNTLIAGNFNGATGTTSDDVYGTLDPLGDYNLIGDGTGMTGLSNGVNGNLVGSADTPIDPLLGPLADNGGLTLTHALLSGSPAIDAGDPAQLGVPDQRGVVRNGGVNIGAYQASASTLVLTAPATVTPGVPFDVTVTAVDAFGQVAVGYTGTVTFSTSDPDPTVVLPADYTFTADDGGVHTFTDTGLGETTLLTPGDQTLTVTDTADSTLTGSTIITVSSTAPGAGPHRLGQPPSPFPASTGQAQAPTRSEPSPHEVPAVDRWFAAVPVGMRPGPPGPG
jgi:hypothetical protein